MTEVEIEKHKKDIDGMSQEAMARLWRNAPSGHPYFVTGTPVWEHFDKRFKGFTAELSKKIGWDGK